MAYENVKRPCDPSTEKHRFRILSGICSKCGFRMEDLVWWGSRYLNTLPAQRELECDEPGGEHVMVEISDIEWAYSEEEERFLYCKFCGLKVPKDN